MHQCLDASFCTANALPGSDYCVAHTGSSSGAEVAKRAQEAYLVSDEAQRPPTGGYPARPRSLDVEALLPFGLESPCVLTAAPQKLFLPKGLMLWDVGALQVESMLVGPMLQLVCSFGKVPAAWFATQQSFEAVVKAQNAGDAAGWGFWGVAYPGCIVRLQFDGPATHVRALMWGLSS